MRQGHATGGSIVAVGAWPVDELDLPSHTYGITLSPRLALCFLLLCPLGDPAGGL
jgi:hypothetical protein